MNRQFVLVNITTLLLLLAVLYQMSKENDRLDKILAKYHHIESRAIYVSGCVYGGGSFDSCTNAYYSHFLPRIEK